jgi:hypothetical protein
MSRGKVATREANIGSDQAALLLRLSDIARQAAMSAAPELASQA